MNPESTPQKVKEILAGIASRDAALHAAALERLFLLPPAVLPALADFMNSGEPAEAKAAKTAMERFVHALHAPESGKDRPDGGVRSRVADQLVEIARSARTRLPRAHALYLLGFSGVRRHEKAIESLEKDKEVGEDARMARERIRSARY